MSEDLKTLNLANTITITRIIFTPFFLICLVYENFVPAFIFFMAGSISDLADGFVARLGAQKTRLGAFLDPLADKLMLIPTYGLLALTGAVPKWFFVILLCRDFSIILGWLIYIINERDFKTHARWAGKFAIASQMALFTLILAGLAFPYLRTPMLERLRESGYYLVALLTFLSFLDYTAFGSKQVVAITDKNRKT